MSFKETHFVIAFDSPKDFCVHFFSSQLCFTKVAWPEFELWSTKMLLVCIPEKDKIDQWFRTIEFNAYFFNFSEQNLLQFLSIT